MRGRSEVEMSSMVIFPLQVSRVRRRVEIRVDLPLIIELLACGKRKERRKI